MQVLKNFRMCRSSVGDVIQKKSHLTKSKTKPAHHQKQQPNEQGQDNNIKINKKKMMMMRTDKGKISPVPAGCFPVYVGLENEKQRFLMKAKQANHPLFRILLNEAESKYGHQQRQGPISLPYDVDLFYKVLAEMDMEDSATEHAHAHAYAYNSNKYYMSPLGSCWNFFIGLGGGHCRLIRRLDVNCSMMTNHSYSLLNQSKLLKLNH